MLALSAFGVFATAKLIVLGSRDLPWLPWTVIAFFWQDALVALFIGLVERLTRAQPWLIRCVYGASVLYVAMNVPLVLVLSSPLTSPMLRATRTTLTDSIGHHCTWQNAVWFGVVVAVGIVLPRLAAVLPARLRCWSALGAVGLCALGPFAVSRVETEGFGRNALFALVRSALPRVIASEGESDWRASPFHRESSQSLLQWRGSAAGRNVVIIVLESTGANYLKAYGASDDPTPNLTKLAEQALIFEHAYAVYPESIKGLFSVLCSRYPAYDAAAEQHARVQTPSLAAVLSQAGYRTALFHSGRFMYLGMEAIVQNRGFDVLADAGTIDGNFNSSFGVEEPAAVERMLAWLDSLPSHQRFCLCYLPIAGHHPYDTPKPGPFPQTDEAGSYRNALHYGDAALGDFLEGLRRRGLETNTLFVIFGDHGEAFGQHPGNYGHTFFIYEENVRVPLLVAAPGLIDRQVRVSRVASLLDTAPTILDLVGVPAPAEYQGASLLDPMERMALFYADYSLGLVGLRDGPWKFIHELDSRRSKLFDLSADPGEHTNLAAHQPERGHAYRQRLRRWSAAQKHLIARAKAASQSSLPANP